MINAFLSYRHSNDNATIARSELKALCEETNEIKLIFDEDATEEDANLIVFMQDLVDARCVFLFLDPSYFESSYTLFELIGINEQEGVDKRFVQAIRLTDEMSTYVLTTAKQYWLEHEEIREGTARLLVKTGRLRESEKHNHDAIWQRIATAWNDLIEDPMDHLKSAAIKEGKPSKTLKRCVEHVIPAVDLVKDEQLKELSRHLGKQIKAVLKATKINLDSFVNELDDPDKQVHASAESIADYMTRDDHLVVDTLSALTRVMESQKAKLGLDSEDWEDCFYDAEQLASWLVLLSIDNSWWFENKNTLIAKLEESKLDDFPLDNKEYVEVVISRSLLQQARFRVNKHSQLEVDDQKQTILMVYDAASKDANQTQLLIDIYKDLCKGEPQKGLSVESLLDKIVRRAKTHKRNSRGKAIYYLVSKETKKLIDSFKWDNNSGDVFKGCLHFICCDVPKKPYEKSASSEDQGDLLDQVAYLLSLNEDQDA